jgi:hypothetical protein
MLEQGFLPHLFSQKSPILGLVLCELTLLESSQVHFSVRTTSTPIEIDTLSSMAFFMQFQKSQIKSPWDEPGCRYTTRFPKSLSCLQYPDIINTSIDPNSK